MIIGIHAKTLTKKQKTGIELYLKNLIKEWQKLKSVQGVKFILYTDKPLEAEIRSENFTQKVLRCFFLWTQLRLSIEMIKICVDLRSDLRKFVLFIPAHVMPLIHPKHTVVTIHGLEYEYFPEYYSWFSRTYLRWSTKYAVRHASKIIAVSENTKKDLVKLYGCEPSKIKVVWHGIENKKQKIKDKKHKLKIKNLPIGNPYFLYLGRIELKKNILGTIRAFDILNTKYKILDTKLVLAGPAGYGYEKIKNKIQKIKNTNKRLKNSIILTGYIEGNKKWRLLKNAKALVFPSFYEGFGLPILEAQSVGVPVITSKGSSMEEITRIKNKKLKIKDKKHRLKIKKWNSETKDYSALLVNPNKPEEITEAMYRIISDQTLCDELIKRGYENVRRFSWEKTARQTLKILRDYL